MRRRAELPAVKHRHLSRLQVLNETGYDSRAIRRLLVRALHSQGMRVRGAVRIVYSSGAAGHHGCAALGDRVRHAGLNMALSVPRDPAALDVGKFARVIRHEVMHWRGVRHVDMTYDQLYCGGPVPEWAIDVTVEHRAKTEPTLADRRAEKLAHAQAMLKAAETRAKRAATIVQRWKRRVRAAERAIAREGAAGPMQVVELAPVAADAGAPA